MYASYYKTICLGDSLTYGYGGEDVLGPFVPYPNQLGGWMNWRQYDNEGVSGETSAQILSRFFAHPGWTENTIVLWTGRNDISLRDDWSAALTIPAIDQFVQAMEAAGNKNYVIVGVTNSGAEYQGAGGVAEQNYNEILAHNQACTGRYPGKFLDIRAWLITTAPFSLLGMIPSPTDMADIAVGKVPTTWRRDATNVHYNTVGCNVIAYRIAQELQKLPSSTDGLAQQGGLTVAGLMALYGAGSLNGADYVRAFKGFVLGDEGTGSGVVLQDNPRKNILMIGGGQAIPDNISGTATTSEWTFVGRGAGGTVGTGRGNTGVGSNSMTAITTGGFNTAVGTNTLKAATTANSNVAIGNDALSSLVDQSSGSTAVGRYALLNFIGTTQCTAIGFQALYLNTTGSGTAVGYSALRNSTTGNNNVAVGHNAMNANTTGGSNTAVGSGALASSTTTNGSTAVGASALTSATGADNTAVGRSAGATLNTGINNTFIGSVAGTAATTMQNSVAVGYQALNVATTANSSVAIGSGALASVVTSTANTALGYRALALATSGNNIGIGYQAGDDITTGSRNLVIGYNIDSPNGTASDQMTIGNLIYGFGMDGSGTTPSTGNVGIGGLPGASGGPKLDIFGDMIRLRTSKTPASASDSGNAGTFCWDASYFYVCTASGTWKRAALSTW